MPNCCILLKLIFIFVDVVYQLEIIASYMTSYECLNGGYGLIGGANLTLEYDYGYNYFEVRIPFITVYVIMPILLVEYS